MMIHASFSDDQALLSREEFERLLELARKSEPVELDAAIDEFSTRAMMQLAETSGSFDFWKEDGENLYSAEDGAPV